MGGREFPNPREAIEFLKRRLQEQKDPRRKLENDLELIRNRRKDEIIFPIPPNHDQKMWFEKLESNGIWERLFEFITDPSDVTSAYFTCDLFRKHLEERRKLALLPKVFGVLRDTNRLNFYPIIDFNNFNLDVEDEEEEEVADTRRDVLNLRLVSKAWKLASEETFHMSPFGFSSNDWRPDIHPVTSNREQCNFSSVNEVESALEALQNPKTCSSLLRKVTVDDSGTRDKEVFYSKLEEFLDIHGSSVWMLLFYIHLKPFGSAYDLNYEGLQMVISRMPNLKMLELFGANYKSEDELAHARLRQMLAQFAFLSMPSLKTLHFTHFHVPNEILLVGILRKCANLSAIYLYWSNEMSDILWDVLKQLPLIDFSVCFHGEGADVGFRKNFLRLRETNWPLQNLSMHNTHSSGFYVSRNASRLIEVLNQFNDSLVQVDLSCRSLKLRNDDKVVVVDFPKLKKLSLPEIRNQ